MRSLKNLLKTSAVVSSITRFVNKEVIEQQLQTLSSSDFINAHIDKTATVLIFSYIAWISIQYSDDKKLSKLELINHYKKQRKNIQYFIYVFAFIFLRNVENAI